MSGYNLVPISLTVQGPNLFVIIHDAAETQKVGLMTFLEDIAKTWDIKFQHRVSQQGASAWSLDAVWEGTPPFRRTMAMADAFKYLRDCLNLHSEENGFVVDRDGWILVDGQTSQNKLLNFQVSRPVQGNRQISQHTSMMWLNYSEIANAKKEGAVAGVPVADTQASKLEKLSGEFFELGGDLDNCPASLNSAAVAVQIGWYSRQVQNLTKSQAPTETEQKEATAVYGPEEASAVQEEVTEDSEDAPLETQF